MTYQNTPDNIKNDDEYLKEMMKDEYTNLSSHLNSMFQNFKNNREQYNLEWQSNDLQYSGEYEKNVTIQEGNSKLFTPITQKKTDQAIAYLINLCLPNGNKNFSMQSTPVPNLPKKVMDQIVSDLYTQALQNQQVDEQGNPVPVNLTLDDVTYAAKKISDIRAAKMQNVILDQLSDQKNSYSSVIENVIRSACVFGSGVALGPYVKFEEETYYEKDDFGAIVVKQRKIPRPFVEFMNIFDCFFDLEAKCFGEDDGAFFYRTLTRSQFEDLKNREDFISDNVKKYLRDKPKGNFQYEPYEQVMKAKSNEQVIQNISNKFRVREYWGTVPSECLKGILSDTDIPDTMDSEVNVWIIDDTILKCTLNPFDGDRPYSVFTLFKTQNKLLGYGYPHLLKHDQQAINSTVRLKHDNMVLTSTPHVEVRDALLQPGTNISSIKPGMVIHRNIEDELLNIPAMSVIRFDSHISELLAVENSYRQNIDDITSIGSVLEGNFQGQAESARTTPGVQAIMSNANNVLKQLARNFDDFNQHLLSMYNEFNLMFHYDDDIKGDYQLQPLVSTSIIEKQITANKLNQLVVTLTPEERQDIDFEKLLDARIRANDLDPEFIKLSANEIANRRMQAQQAQDQQMQMAQQAQQMQAQQQQVDNQSKMAKANLDNIKAQTLTDTTDIHRMNSLSKIQQDQAKQNLAEGQFTNQIMNEDFNNFTKEELIAFVQKMMNQNPNITKG